MSEFPSWIEKDGNCYWNTDALLDQHGIDYEDGVGHSAIRLVWNIRGGEENDFPEDDIPPEMAVDIKSGKCRKMMKAAGIVAIHYNSKGQLHRDDGPAIEKADGYKAWYRRGKLHRENGPAVEYRDGYKEWYRHGEQHRDDGPAVIWPQICKMWYQRGELVKFEAW